MGTEGGWVEESLLLRPLTPDVLSELPDVHVVRQRVQSGSSAEGKDRYKAQLSETLQSYPSTDSGCDCDGAPSPVPGQCGWMDEPSPVPGQSEWMDEQEGEVSDVRVEVEQIQEAGPSAAGCNDFRDVGTLFSRQHSESVTPTVTFEVFDSVSVASEGYPDEPLMAGLHPPPSRFTPPLSTSSSTASMPFCRICHGPAEEDNLISPCRCTGTMQYIHTACLTKWLEVCSRRSSRPPSCELCHYQFHRHKKFRVNHWQFPSCSLKDKILNTICFISSIVLVVCAVITILCFKEDKGVRKNFKDRENMSQTDMITVTCGILFFTAFFVILWVEIKARNNIIRLLSKFIYLNQQWYIDEYDRKQDVQHVNV